MMIPKWRYIASALGILVSNSLNVFTLVVSEHVWLTAFTLSQTAVHLLLSITHPTYSSYTSPAFLRGSGSLDYVQKQDPIIGNLVVPPGSVPRNHTDPDRRKANAAFVVLGES